MSREGSISSQGITRTLLIALSVGAVIGTALVFPGVGLLYKEIKKEQWKEIRRRLRPTIKRLERQKLVSWRERDGELRLTLTENGKHKILQYKMDNLQIKNKKKDGLWRIIIFDIPNDKKQAREIFREKLKLMDFYQLQESVFVTPYECRDEIDFLSHNLGVHNNIQYILAKEISGLKV